MKHRVLVLALVSVIAIPGAKAGSPDVALLTLTADSSKTIAVAPFAYQGSAQCDGRGDLFFYVGSGKDSAIYQLRADGSHTTFGLTGTEAQDNYYVSFRASRAGNVWILTGNHEEVPVIFEFHDDATSPSATKLDAHAGLRPPGIRDFIVLNSGHILVHGYFTEKDDKNKGHSYIALFDSSGTLVRKTIDKAYSKDASHWAGDASALEGEDGLIYILQLDKVLVLSQTAERVKEIKFDSTDPDYIPGKMYLSGTRLAVQFYKRPEKTPSKVIPRYAIFDTSSGALLHQYEPAAELGNNLLCYSSDGFTFYRIEQGRIKLVTAKGD